MAVLPLLRHAESAAADLAASSLGLGIPVLPIEGARTYAPGISMGTVGVFPAFSTPSPAARSRRRGRPRPRLSSDDHLRVQDSIYGHILYYLARVAASCRRLAQWFDTVVQEMLGRGGFRCQSKLTPVWSTATYSKWKVVKYGTEPSGLERVGVSWVLNL